MQPQGFSSAQEFMWKNARLLDRQLFDRLFCGGASQGVVAALRAYQNPDGGFGHALEPDKRCPESQPVDVEQAFHILDWIGAFDDPEISGTVVREMVLPACDFLVSITTPEGGVPFALPSVNDYPHASWWTVEGTPPPNLNPTAGIAGLLLKHQIEHPWLEKAVDYCWQAIEASESNWYHEVVLMVAFLEHAPDRARAERNLARIKERIALPGAVELDPQAGGYVKKPLDWAPVPGSLFRSLFDDDTIARHLAALAALQQEDGGWPISWGAVSPGVELEWRGRVTIEALWTLKAYGA